MLPKYSSLLILLRFYESQTQRSCTPRSPAIPSKAIRFANANPPLTVPGRQAYAIAYALIETKRMTEPERHVRLFRNGRNQALRIPREFELEGDEAIIRKEGDRLIVEPLRKGRLLALLATLDPLDETFPDVDDDLPELDDPEL